jgi:hypothetical protein
VNQQQQQQQPASGKNVFLFRRRREKFFFIGYFFFYDFMLHTLMGHGECPSFYIPNWLFVPRSFSLLSPRT